MVKVKKWGGVNENVNATVLSEGLKGKYNIKTNLV